MGDERRGGSWDIANGTAGAVLLRGSLRSRLRVRMVYFLGYLEELVYMLLPADGANR